jgi:hypothetical protein
MKTNFKGFLEHIKKYLFLLACCGLMLVASSHSGQKTATDAHGVDVVDIVDPVDGKGLVTIDIAADYPTEKITLQNIADVEYIPLVISKDVLLKHSDDIFYLSDKYIMILGNDCTICVFNHIGEIVSHFNRRGRGPNEYLRIWGITFDEKAEEIFIVSGGPGGKILVYTIDGTHKRTLPIPEDWFIRGVWDFDDKSLLVYDENNVYYSISFDNRVEEKKFSTTPYHLISKFDGSIVETLPMKLPKRYSDLFKVTTKIQGGVQTQDYELAFSGNKHYGGKDFTLVDMSSDTVYRYSREHILTPVLVRTPSVHATEPNMVWSANLITDNFIVFTIATLDFDGALKNGTFPLRELIYNFKTGQIYEPNFIDNNTSRGWSTGYSDTKMPVNWTVDMLDPLWLVEAREKGELSGPLSDVAATLKEDDNPVVMIVKFK